MKLLLYVVLLLVVIGNAQTIEWVATYNGPGDSSDSPHAMVIDDNANIYVIGSSMDTSGLYDFVTVKYSSAGVEQWLERYNGATGLYDTPDAIAVDGSGNVYVTGGTQVSPLPTVRYDYLTVKYDSTGTLRWAETFNGPSDRTDYAVDVAVGPQGNVYVTGFSHRQSTGSDYLTIAYDSLGATLWTRRYFGPDSANSLDDYAEAIAVDDDGNVYVTGYIRYGTSHDSYGTVKYDMAGNTVWTAEHVDPAGTTRARFIAVDHNGNVYVTGESYAAGTNADYLTFKYNVNGDSVWARRYNGPGSDQDQPNGMVIDSAGNVYVTGQSAGSGTYDDCTTIKYASDGTEEWVATYTSPGSWREMGTDVAVDNSGNVFVSAATREDNNWDYATIKYDSMGVEQWVALYSGPDSLTDIPRSIVFDSEGAVYVTGSSDYFSTNYDFATIKYSQLAIHEDSHDSALNTHNLQIFPTLSNQQIHILYSVRIPSEVALRLYDLTGRVIETIQEGTVEAGSHEMILNCTDLASGIYFICATSGNTSSAKKIIVYK
jgi:hypothetical protein